MIFGILAISFDLQFGRTSLLNFGHVALFGVGAYSMAFGLEASIPYPLVLVLSMMVGGGLGLIMGLTTSRMRGTAFAFIALAIAMFLFNFFAENPDLSGGETGLGVPTPDIIRTGPFYMFFVILAFTFIAAFIGSIIMYMKKRNEPIGLFLLSSIMIAFTGILFVLGTNIIGPILAIIAFLGMVLLFWLDRNKSIDPLQFSETTQSMSSEVKTTSILTTYVMPLMIIIIAITGFVFAFGTNIAQMVSLWIEDSSTFYYTIPVQYYLVLTCVVITYVFVKRIVASPFGRMVAAVAQNEERAEALGYNSYHAKIMMMVLAGALAGLAGALYAPFIRTIDPHTVLGVEVTINAMLFTIIGGVATLFGPLLGAGIVEYSESYLVDVMRGLGLPGELWIVALGVMYIFIVLFMPLGIVGSIGRRAGSLKERLRRIKIRQFEFGLKDADYWVFGLLGMIGLILFLLEDARFLIIVIGIFGFLGAVGLLLLIVFRREIRSSIRGRIGKWSTGTRERIGQWRSQRGGN
jgi:ABC-type branched-subunit amino acid transport system permease subunit